MTFNRIRSILLVNFILILCSTLLPTGYAYALADDPSNVALPSLERFVGRLKNGQAEELRGVYIPGVLAAGVVEQPAGMDDFVSPWDNTLTRFNLASRFGSTGLLAHNHLAGKTFTSLQIGQEIYLVYGDGHVSTFVVSGILHYQASDPDSTSSSFLDLEDGDSLTTSELFAKVYNRPGQLILQTCIAAGETLSWGRLFVIAKPIAPRLAS
jgi:hypothetical protein